MLKERKKTSAKDAGRKRREEAEEAAKIAKATANAEAEKALHASVSDPKALDALAETLLGKNVAYYTEGTGVKHG